MLQGPYRFTAEIGCNVHTKNKDSGQVNETNGQVN